MILEFSITPKNNLDFLELTNFTLAQNSTPKKNLPAPDDCRATAVTAAFIGRKNIRSTNARQNYCRHYHAENHSAGDCRRRATVWSKIILA